jgi:hypothetical protein
METMCKCLGIKGRFQKEAILILASSSSYYFWEGESFRIKLIESLKKNSSAVRIGKVNAVIDSLVEERLLVRVKVSGKCEIGLNTGIWGLSPEIIGLIQHVTMSITKHLLSDSDLCQVVQDVKLLFRKFGYTRKQISDTAFDILVVRFRALPKDSQQKQSQPQKPNLKRLAARQVALDIIREQQAMQRRSQQQSMFP